MDVTQPITRSFADEHVIGTDPPMRPELSGYWRRRINAFAGRALSDKAMTAEQDLRSGMQRLYGLSLNSGVVEGLAVSPEQESFGLPPADATIQISPGLGIARSGEDISIGRTVRIPVGDIPVILRVDHADALAGEGVPSTDTGPLPDEPAGAEGSMAERLRPELPRKLGDILTTIAENPESTALPHVAVLVAQPIVAEILGRPLDQCPPDPRDDPYIDLQRIDGARLALYLWPAEMVALDGGADYALPADGPSRRNRLSYGVFETERLLVDDEMHPWEAWGVPLALIGFTPDWRLDFVDCHAVARVGGTPKERSPLVPRSGDARLWQARLDQFATQISQMPSFDAAALQDAFVRMPPVGILPPEMFDMVRHKQHFFPSGYTVSAVPVAHSNFNLVVSESAGLAPFDRGQPDGVQILVPVPDSVYEPGLLQVEQEDTRFGQAIKAIRDDRTRWLVRRQMARRRYDRLLETVSGVVMGWPGSDLPLEENSPAPHVQTPVEVTRTRRVAAAASATRSHIMANANATLTVAASDTIWFWVCIHDGAEMTGLSLRLATGSRTGTAPSFAKGVFWGGADGLPIAAEAGGLEKRRIGDLPASGVWVRLEVPASAVWDANGGNLDGFAVNAIEFTQLGGDVEWASLGKMDAAGMVYTYIADDAPAGATLTAEGSVPAGWPWTPVVGREEIIVDDFGTALTGDVRRAAALDSFRDLWKQEFLSADLANVDENGIAVFLSSVEARLKATNDAIDLGFVRARADIYRVRQIMLGADAASRLVTSPSLADLAERDEGARATSQGISDFLKAAVVRTPAETVINIGTPTPTPTPTPSTGVFQPQLMTLNIARTARFFTAAAPPPPSAIATFMPMAILSAPLMSTTALSSAATRAASPAAATALAAPASVFQTAVSRQNFSIEAVSLARDTSRYRTMDIQRQIPIAGLVERTASVAERLKPQPAVQALEYALASKAAVVTTLSGLSGLGGGRPIGIALADIPMAGFRKKGTPAEVPTLAQLLADKDHAVFEDADTLPAVEAQKHEADYFTAAVQAIDNSIAIMRLVEGRVALFEELSASLNELKAAIEDSANGAAAYLRSVDVEVAEARHDLATAERLREEERARIDGVNLRRAAILETHVNAIAWRRLRSVDVRDDIPLIEAASGLAPSPIAICRKEHDEAPDEIHDYVQLLREVPVSWFPAIAAMVPRIERLDSAHAVLHTMIERAIVPRVLAAPVQVTATSRYLKGVQNAMVAGRRIIEARQTAVTMLNVARIPALSLAEAHVQLTSLSTIGDLIAGTHRQPALTRAASEEIDAITAIAGCLHESFGEVSPIVRLGWAEVLSQFDQPAPLSNLAGLSGWGEVPVELRRTLQGFVDWLFGRIDQKQDAAHDAINELVRICLLMAAHAPVDKIIPAHLVAPAPAKLGSKLFLTLDIKRVRKGMTTLIRDDRDRIISRAVIDDIVDGRAQATITQVSAAITTITPAMRFQLVGGIVK
jgi:hypothetical protein